MTTTPPAPPNPGDTHDAGPRVTRDEVRDLGRLRRSLVDRRVAGVAGGLGRHLDVDPLILRVAFVVLTFFGGAGLLLYGACWLLVPEEGSERAAIALDDRSRGVALIIVGALAALGVVGGAWGNHAWFPWPLIAVGLVAWLVLSRKDRTGPRNAASSGHVAAPAYGAYASAPTDATTESAVPADQQASGGHAPPTAPAWGYTPPPPRDPRRRGPILFWITLALIALAVGVLGIVDLAGAHVAGSAYPATALAVTAAMLLVGSVYGRAGGLILLGFICTFATVGATIGDELDGEHLRAQPTSADQVADSYDVDAGEVELDLSRVSDLEELDGRTIDMSASVGHLRLVVPRKGLDVEINTDIDGPGGYHLFAHDGGGIDEHLSDQHDGGRDVPSVTINTRVNIGAVDVEVK